MPVGRGHPQGIRRQPIKFFQFTQSMGHAAGGTSHPGKLPPNLVPVAGQASAMIDQPIAERNCALLQRLGRPFSILTEFDVSDRTRFECPVRPAPPNGRHPTRGTGGVGRVNCALTR